MKSLAIILALGTSGAVLAQPAAYLGTRCSESEDIHVEPNGVGFNEHTVCTWVNAPTVKSASVHGVVACQNIYILDASTDPVTTEILDQGTRHLRMVLINDIDMDVYLDRVPIGRFGACG
ncbi:MAG: hypothetical protein AAFN63_06200 [Pseudomonadota bacterium]